MHLISVFRRSAIYIILIFTAAGLECLRPETPSRVTASIAASPWSGHMTEIAQSFENRENVKVSIAQGGSEDLFQSAKKSGAGDWYLPGEPSYYQKHVKEGLFDERTTVGHNQMALMVQKRATPRASSPMCANCCAKT
jgi:ABC-type molybdate transport system substrate-binding protein